MGRFEYASRRYIDDVARERLDELAHRLELLAAARRIAEQHDYGQPAEARREP